MLQRVYPEVAQNAAGQGTESGAAGYLVDIIMTWIQKELERQKKKL